MILFLRFFKSQKYCSEAEDTDGIEEHGIQVVSEPGDSSQKGELANTSTQCAVSLHALR